MKTKTVNTNELTAKALDWAVGVAVGDPQSAALNAVKFGGWSPTTNWGQMGAYMALIDYVDSAEGLLVGVFAFDKDDGYSFGSARSDKFEIALCRAIVDLYLGETVDVPEVLV